jgi:2-iminobutanoate/2-iminopropanoate deaminase
LQDFIAKARAGFDVANADFCVRRAVIKAMDMRATLKVMDGQYIVMPIAWEIRGPANCVPQKLCYNPGNPHSQERRWHMMDREVLATEKAPAAIGPYSQAVRAGDFLFTAGQAGLVPGTKGLAGADIESQTRQTLENLKAILEVGGSCLKHVVKTTVFLADMAEFSRMNSVYAEFFPEAPPARSTVQVAALPMAARVEIEVVALVCNCQDGEGCECNCTRG